MMQPFWRKAPKPPPRQGMDTEQLERAWRDEKKRRREKLAKIEQELSAFPDLAAILAETASKEDSGHGD
jgi:hypothetical protein